MAVAKFWKRDAGFGSAVFAAGFLLSWLPLVLAPPVFYAADELFQFLETGHRLVFGYGMVPWEFDYNARSWLLGYGAALPMFIARLLGAGPGFYLPLVWALFSLPAGGAVLCAGLWGRRAFGLAGGWTVALVAASWVDNLAFGGRVLSETVSAHLLIIAVWLAEPGYKVEDRRRLMLSGLLATLAVLLRLQLGPAALLLWLWRWRDYRRFALLSVGAGAALLLDGTFDAATTSYPFQPLWENFRFNLLLKGADSFGTEPPWYYFAEFWQRWGFTALPFAGLALLGGRRQPLLLAMTGVILVVHMIIPHKEYRFLLPGLMLAAILCGLGLAEAVRGLSGFLARRWGRIAALAVPALAGLAWSGMAAANAAALFAGDAWHVPPEPLDMVLELGRQPDVCGIGFANITRYQTGGYTFLHRPIPIFHSVAADVPTGLARRHQTPDEESVQRWFSADMVMLIRWQPAYNALVIKKVDLEFFEAQEPFAGYRLDHCSELFCLLTRAGDCHGKPPPPPPIGELPYDIGSDPRYPYTVGVTR